MVLYAVGCDIYVEASGPQEAEAIVQTAVRTLQKRKRVVHTAVGLSREADESEVTEG